MNLILLVSLSAAILLVAIEFLSGEKKMWIRFSCCILSIVSISAAYRICKDDAGRMHKIKSEASNSRELLKKAENIMATQSAILSGEIEKMHAAIKFTRGADTTVKHSLFRLQNQIKSMQQSTKQLNAQMQVVYADRSPDSLFNLSAAGLTDLSVYEEADNAEVIVEGNN